MILKRFVVAACTLGLLAAPALAAQKDEPVLAKRGVEELRAAENENFIAWVKAAEGTHRQNVFVKRKGGAEERLNPTGTRGTMGGISGDRLVYQVFNQGDNFSDLRMYSLRNERHRDLPNGINTSKWEYWPSLSGKWLLFARHKPGREIRQLVLANLKTGKQSVIRTTNDNRMISPGQVRGDFVVWDESKGARHGEVYRYTISNGRTRHVSEGDRLAYGPSVAPGGAVFMVRSGFGCGKNVEIVRWFSGDSRTVLAPPDGIDMWGTEVFKPETEKLQILHERIKCPDPSSSNVYRLVLN